MRLLELYRILDEEAELLFELRNVLNVDELKQWAARMAEVLAGPFETEPQVSQAVEKWGTKALLKYAVNDMPGSTVRPAGSSGGEQHYHVGNNETRKMSEFPVWAQHALKRGDELTWVDPWKQTIRNRRNVQRDVQQVRDWLRFKYQQNPREFTPNRLARIPWTEAIRLTDEYHAALAAEQAKIATLEDVGEWFIEHGYKTVPRYQHTSNSGREAIWRNMSDYERIKIVPHFEKATGKKYKPPEDDPSGHEPFIQYAKGGGMMEPAEEIPPTPSRMDLLWQDHPELQDEPVEVQHHNFVPAPEIGEQWVKLTTGQCVKYEGTLMGHCVGGYEREVEAGDVWIFSFRDKDNQPHITIEVAPPVGSEIEIQQIKGKENKPPVAKYHDKVIDFLRIMKSRYDVIYAEEAEEDLSGMGMFPEGYGSALEIKAIRPPYDMDKFVKYEITQDPPEEDEYGEVDEWPESEVTDQEEGNLVDLLDSHQSVKEFVTELMNSGSSCWYGEEQQDYHSGGFTRTEICYNGDYAQREWVTVLE